MAEGFGKGAAIGGPYLFGYLIDATGSTTWSLAFVAAVMVAGSRGSAPRARDARRSACLRPTSGRRASVPRVGPWLDLRLLLIAACGGSAGIHAGLVAHHWEESPAFGVLFILAAVGLAVTATALAGWPEASLPLFAAAGLLCSLIAAFVAAREPLDALVVVTKAIEAAGLVAALLLLRRPPSRPSDLALAYFGLPFVLAFTIAAASGHTG